MSFNKTKCDPELGRQIQLHLLAQGVQTPMEFLNADEERAGEGASYTQKEEIRPQ